MNKRLSSVVISFNICQVLWISSQNWHCRAFLCVYNSIAWIYDFFPLFAVCFLVLWICLGATPWNTVLRLLCLVPQILAGLLTYHLTGLSHPPSLCLWPASWNSAYLYRQLQGDKNCSTAEKKQTTTKCFFKSVVMGKPIKNVFFSSEVMWNPVKKLKYVFMLRLYIHNYLVGNHLSSVSEAQKKLYNFYYLLSLRALSLLFPPGRFSW